MYQHKKNSCFLFLLSPTLYVSLPGGLLYSCALPEHGLSIMEYISTLITVKYRQTNSVLMEVPERHQRNHVTSGTWMSLLQRSHLQGDNISASLLSHCVTAWIFMLLKTNLLISMHNLINAKESVWNSLIHSWLFCVSAISVVHTITAVDTLRLNLPNNSHTLPEPHPIFPQLTFPSSPCSTMSFFLSS